MRVAVIDSGVANLASVSTALRSLGAEVSITDDSTEVRRASHVVLPGRVVEFASVPRTIA